MLSTPRGCLSTLEPMHHPVAFRRIAGEMAKPAPTVYWLYRFRLEILIGEHVVEGHPFERSGKKTEVFFFFK